MTARTILIPPRPPRGGEHRARTHRPAREGRPAVWRTTVAAALVFAAGLAAAHTATDGFEAYTLESARRLAALRSPAPVPDLVLESADGGAVRLGAMTEPVLLVDFVYTRCPTTCQALGSVYARLQERLAPEIASGKVRLVSISFDPRHDGPSELRAYRARYSRDSAGWSLARPVHETQLDEWLAAFGVVVIPDGMGGYTHNAAAHVIGPDRRLAAILDIEDIGAIERTARIMAAGGKQP
jgi:protein SCO1/2